MDSSPEDEDFPGRLLHQASLWDNNELLEDLLQGDTKQYLNSTDSSGRTPLHAAATNDTSKCLRILLESGANPNVQSVGDKKTPLHVAAEHGHTDNVTLLLEYNASFILKDSDGFTPLARALARNHVKAGEVLQLALREREKGRQLSYVELREACAIGDVKTVLNVIAAAGDDGEVLINMAPNGANTLLFQACQMGRREIVRILLDHGADARVHPVTKYSPMYIAAHHGHLDIVEMLLERFPELVQQQTVEKWLPIHACCISGDLKTLETLLNFPYPSHVMQQFTVKHENEQYEYSLPFDINQKDVSGQTILYVASFLGNLDIVNMLVNFRVTAVNQSKAEMVTPEVGDDATVSPSKRRVSNSIQSIMSRLNLRAECVGADELVVKNDTRVRPVLVDLYCVNDSETALHIAVKSNHYNIVAALLAAGASPNLSIKPSNVIEESMRSTMGDDDPTYGGASTALVEACAKRDTQMCELLLKYGARDDDCKALSIAAKNKEDKIVARLLTIKAYADPEYKINKKIMTESVTPASQSLLSPQLTTLTYSTIFPNVATMINWHNQKCNLTEIRSEWLIECALNLNIKLRQNPRCHQIALFAITRLDVSNNALQSLPIEVFQLASLKYLNVAQNKIERLPMPQMTTIQRRYKNKYNTFKYDCPALEELYLQDNRLEDIPDIIFDLPALVTLVLSNNKLQYLPFAMWRAPKLKELNVAFNLLKDLPGSRFDDLRGLAASNLSESSHSLAESSEHDESASDSEFPDLSDAESTDSSDLPSVYRIRYQRKHPSVVQLELNKHNLWTKNIELTEQTLLHADESVLEKSSKLSALNLAHNLFSSIPPMLSCHAVNLTRLNMAYNNLHTMSFVTSYPATLKQLDLSHNSIKYWPSLPQADDVADPVSIAHVQCYCSVENGGVNRPKLPAKFNRRDSSRSVRNAVMQYLCIHRRHFRLENLRTLVLADNCLTRIQLTTGADDQTIFDSWSHVDEDDSDWNAKNTCKVRLIFPNLSMLDISNNKLKEVPSNIHELTNLSVLNLSGNLDISELPCQMGLLSRLWNLNTRGCALQEPLKSMIDGKKYKTMDVIGYLKSILEDAKPYARMKLMIVGVQGIGKTSLLEQLRLEGCGSSRKKPVEHWAKRMGNKNINVKTSRGTNMSTVGVDIGDWVFEKKIRGQSTHGPVTFRTWDFGGQKEYYATHQYFLSKRSLYLVVWKISDGHKGVDEILQWLVNIQARAPNSPVIIVGTHYDQVLEFNYPNSWCEELQQTIRERFINVVDAEKSGLPRVLDTIEISCKSKHNVKLLCNLIYEAVFNLRLPGSKELMLEQRVPATYLALEDVVNFIAAERRSINLDPVLTSDQFKALVAQEMNTRYGKTFRDCAELHQATLFLHDNARTPNPNYQKLRARVFRIRENRRLQYTLGAMGVSRPGETALMITVIPTPGVLLHYDDSTLKNLYFLDPQWLCDMLAHVVTIREINPFARSGIMKLDDLKHIFKASNIVMDQRGYIVNLLNKFEVALTWDSRTLLIPSLLPAEEDIKMYQFYPGSSSSLVKVSIPLRSRGWAMRNKKISISTKSVLYNASTSANFVLNAPSVTCASANDDATEKPVPNVFVSHRVNVDKAMTRLLLMSYFPSGFWSRLITRILADDSVIDIVRSYFEFPKEILQNANLSKILDAKAEWVLWQSGLQLKYGDITLFLMREVLHTLPSHYRALNFRVKLEGQWCPLNISNSSILEVYFPVESLVVNLTDNPSEAITIEPNVECTAQLLALAVDHIDVLLEDWYPTLGTRFVHTSEGKYLVTRLIPCPKCMNTIASECENSYVPFMPGTTPSPGQNDTPNKNLSDALKKIPERSRSRTVRMSQDSYTSEGDSGVGRDDSTDSSRQPSVEGYVNPTPDPVETPIFYSWMVEECILEAYGTKKCVVCPNHGDVMLERIAPDTIFMDLSERYLIRPEHIKKGRLLGRGAFGFVFKGVCKMRGTNTRAEVAMKMLQPVQPGPNARPSAVIAFKAAQGKWDRDPIQYACKAYCTARQELNILLTLNHPNIVPLIGVCITPLALILDLAPHGALDATLRHYRRSGAKIGPFTLQAIVLQVAKAIEYLHRQHIIYRDLKSENVLVWDMPPPFDDHPNNVVHIKVADYGISRLTLPSGAKGFGGTEGFMAPEIMRYNGEEEYTEKVDCFSFGMFVYELLTLHQPFEGCDSVKESILEGERPPLTYRETAYPTYVLDLMVMCWSQQPIDRPSASQIVSIVSAPEFTHLYDVMSLNHSAPVVAADCVLVSHINDPAVRQNDCHLGAEIWCLCANGRVDLLLLCGQSWIQYSSLQLSVRPTAACVVNSVVWIGDCLGSIHAFHAASGVKLFTYKLETDSTVPTSVVSLLYIPTLQRVACALSNGRLLLTHSDIMPNTPTSGEGTFVKAELGPNQIIHSLCYIAREDDKTTEIWCGNSDGKISIFTLENNVVKSHECVEHFNGDNNSMVLKLVPITDCVLSYVCPGCSVYQWDVKTRKLVNKLDCSKLVPCSESIKSISIEEHLTPGKCQVTYMAAINNDLYIGTTWGCIVLAERKTLRPITVFRPFEEEVRSIIPIKIQKAGEGKNVTSDCSVVTIGRGYRNLLKRYVDRLPSSMSITSLKSPASAGYSPCVALESDRTGNICALVWRSENWATN